MFKTSPLLCLFFIGFALASEAENEGVTKFFQELITRKSKLAPETKWSYGSSINGFRIFLQNLKVESGYDKNSISVVSAQVRPGSYKAARKIRLTFELKNGKVSSQKATVGEIPDEHKGNYETSFETAQMGMEFKWTPRLLPFPDFLHVDVFSDSFHDVLSTTGLKHSWTGFDVDIEKILEGDENNVEDRVSKMAIAGVARSWWQKTVVAQQDFIQQELNKVIKSDWLIRAFSNPPTYEKVIKKSLGNTLTMISKIINQRP